MGVIKRVYETLNREILARGKLGVIKRVYEALNKEILARGKLGGYILLSGQIVEVKANDAPRSAAAKIEEFNAPK